MSTTITLTIRLPRLWRHRPLADLLRPYRVTAVPRNRLNGVDGT